MDGVLQNTYAFTCGAGPLSFDLFDYCFYQGTSMAAPHVTGTAALLLSEHPALDLSEVRDVDYADAVTQLQQTMTQLQVSMQVTSRLLNLSLMDFIR